MFVSVKLDKSRSWNPSGSEKPNFMGSPSVGVGVRDRIVNRTGLPTQVLRMRAERAI